jgi:hypothetical protein
MSLRPSLPLSFAFRFLHSCLRLFRTFLRFSLLSFRCPALLFS